MIIAFLWRDFHNVDTDGDATNPASRDWTVLHCMNREKTWEMFDVLPVEGRPELTEVIAGLPYLAARVAYFLATESNSAVAENERGPWLERECLRDKVGDFDLAQAQERADRSRWRRATLANPYADGGESA